MNTGKPSNPARDIALIATFAALIAVCSLLAAPIGPSGVPITLQTFAVLLAGLVLGPRRGALAVLLYLVVGAVGIPVFAGGRSGLAAFQGASAGYLMAFPFAAAVAGGWLHTALRRGARWIPVHAGIAAALATVVIYAGGVPVLSLRWTHDLGVAFVYNLGFVPFDLLKAGISVMVALAVLRAFPALVPRPVALAAPASGADGGPFVTDAL